MESNEETKLLRWEEQLPTVIETSIDRRYFKTARDETELHVFAAEIPMRHISLPQLKLKPAVMAVRLKEQIVNEHELKIINCNFWSDSTIVLQWIHSFYSKQQVL